jgi:hypothetical protein
MAVPWYLISEMEKNGQFGPAFAMPYYSVQGLFAPSSLVISRLSGILAVVVVVIGRISLHAETG